jgi:hypothetical protein
MRLSLFVALLTLGTTLVLAGCGDDSNPAGDPGIIDTTPPSTPEGLIVQSTHTGLQVEWDDNSEADLAGYVLEKSADRGSTWADLTGVLTDSSYEDAFATRADYRVRASDLVGNESSPSTPVTYLAPTGGGPKIPAIPQ